LKIEKPKVPTGDTPMGKLRPVKYGHQASIDAFTSLQLVESSTIVDYGMKAIGQLLDKIFYLLLSELLKKIPKELI
jgi:hypothetical protein